MWQFFPNQLKIFKKKFILIISQENSSNWYKIQEKTLKFTFFLGAWDNFWRHNEFPKRHSGAKAPQLLTLVHCPELFDQVGGRAWELTLLRDWFGGANAKAGFGAWRHLKKHDRN